MKSLLVFSALVTLTIAVPTYSNNGEINLPRQSYLPRYKKSTSPELSSDAVPAHKDAAKTHEDTSAHEDGALTHKEAATSEEKLTEGRTIKLIKKLQNHEPHIHHHYSEPTKHYPGHNFRENEKIQIDAKEAIEDIIDDEMHLRPPTHDDQNKKTPTHDEQDNKTPISTQRHDLEKNIHIAKEAVDSIKNNFEEISKSSSGNADWKNSESDKTFKHGLQTAKEALDLVHKSFHDFENIEAKDAITSSSKDVPVQMVKMTEERNKQWKESQDVQAKNVESQNTLLNTETVHEEKPKEAEDLTMMDQEGHMSQRIETVQKPEALIAPETSEQKQKSAVLPFSNSENQKMINMNKIDDDLKMKSADDTVSQNINNLNIPEQNTESKTKFIQTKPKSIDINDQQIPKGRNIEHDHPMLHTEKLVEPKTTTQNLFTAPIDSKPKSSMNLPQTLHKSEHQMHGLKHPNHPQGRGAYNIGGAGAAYGPAIHPVGGATSGHGGAVGVFPNANIGGCAIPLLLSCSPSVISGSLSKYPSGGSSYGVGAPAYRANLDARMIDKRNIKKQPSLKELKHTAILGQH